MTNAEFALAMPRHASDGTLPPSYTATPAPACTEAAPTARPDDDARRGHVSSLIQRAQHAAVDGKRRHWSPERSRTLRRYRLVILTLCILLAWALAGVFSLFAINGDLRAREARVLADLTDALDAMRDRAAAQGRAVPTGSRPFETDVLIPLKVGPLRDVIFSLGGTADAPLLYARLRVANSGGEEINPRAHLSILGRWGEVVGELASDPSRGLLDTPLAPGETRVVTLDLPITPGPAPTWFLLEPTGPR